MNSVKSHNFDLITFHGLNEIFYIQWFDQHQIRSMWNKMQYICW